MDAGAAALAGLLAGTMAAALLGNALALLCLLRPAPRRPAPAPLALNLTCGHLLSAAVSMPLTLAGLVAQRPPAARLCRLAGFLDTFLAGNAMLGAAALGLDRWAAVAFPLRYRARLRPRAAALLLGAAWLPALAFAAAALARPWLGFHAPSASCALRSRRPDPRFAAFAGAFHALSFLLAGLALCAADLRVLRVARAHCRRIDVITAPTLALLADLHPSVRERCLEERRRRRQRATRRISAFIGTFLLCFGPYVLTRLVELWAAVPIPAHWGVLSKCLAYSKAASDPFVYSLLRRPYRQSCKELLARLFHRPRLRSPGPAGGSHSQNALPVAE